ncbi:A disintegrin and metalloproteinase with thrombospondin motifs 2-like, partial [Silurus asotus]
DSLQHVLGDYGLVRPVLSDAHGRFLSHAVSSGAARGQFRRRWRREAEPAAEPRGDDERLYYNVTVFGREFHLRLRHNTRLVAPGAKMEWQTPGGARTEALHTDCMYVGDIADVKGASVAISNCDGLAGMIRTEKEEFFIEPVETGHQVIEQEDGGGGRPHIVYRSAAVKKPPASPLAAGLHSRGADLRGLLDLETLYEGVERSVNQSRRARRQSPERAYNIEVLLGVDDSVVQFHGAQHVEKYLLTLMNIVNEIYHDHSLGARINVVLVRIVLVDAKKSTNLIELGNPSQSLENVCRWAFEQQRKDTNDKDYHDHAIFLTRQEFGPTGMQGYAPVTGMCHPVRSCTLNHEDGFSSAFVVAHETGHVLGMEHDGQGNRCGDEVQMGSIMAPLVQAAFHRFHWSRCSQQELGRYLHSYDCLRDDPFEHTWEELPQLPGLHYSMNEQCRFDFGAGYMMCTAYRPFDPCKQLWCAHPDNPFFCKTKKGPPIDGTICGDGKHCFKGHCMWLTPDIIKRDGNWGMWSEYGACNRPCGRGLQFRTRACDNPRPANGGRTCPGSNYQFQVCNTHECEDPYRDYRADQCSFMDSKFEYHNMKHHWLPYEHPDREFPNNKKLQYSSEEGVVVVSLSSSEEGVVVVSLSSSEEGLVVVSLSSSEEGVVVVSLSSSEEGLVVVSLSSSEEGVVVVSLSSSEEGVMVVSLSSSEEGVMVVSLSSSEEGVMVVSLSSSEEGVMVVSLSSSEEGVMVVSLSSSEEGVVVVSLSSSEEGVMVVSLSSSEEARVKVSIKYITNFDRLSDRSNENNMVPDNAVPYSWVVKKWTPCSKSCGTGTQMTRYGCRKNSEMRLVNRRFCEKIKKPSVIFRDCYLRECAQPIWVTGDWGECSKSCGRFGTQTRSVRCVQPLRDGKFKSIRSRYCNDERPEARRDCNRMLCPAEWKLGPWSQCSVTCGKGTQERQVLCHTRDNTIGLCLESKPLALRSCSMDPCSNFNKHGNFLIQWLSRQDHKSPVQRFSSSQCRTDRSMLCKMATLQQYCNIPAFQRICCNSCSKANTTNIIPTTIVAHPLTTPRVSTTSPGFIVKTTRAPATVAVMSSTTNSVSSREYNTNTWEYTILTTATRVEATTQSIRLNTPSNFLPRTSTSFDLTTQSANDNVTLSIKDDAIQNNTNTTGINQPEERMATSSVMTTSSVTIPSAATVSTSAPTILTTSRPAIKEEENNLIEVPFQISGVDNEFPEDNIIPRKGRIFLRERTRNKRIQELLEEKRNFLRRMKRAQG